MPDDPDGPRRYDPRYARIRVAVNDAQTALTVDREDLGRVVVETLAAEGVGRALVSITLGDDAAVREVNRRCLGHDWDTDVITFPLSEPGDPTLEADLVVSAEMAARTAAEHGEDPRSELTLYVVHGLLHLCGCDDRTPDAADAMRTREARALRRLGIKNTYGLVGKARGGATS